MSPRAAPVLLTLAVAASLLVAEAGLGRIPVPPAAILLAPLLHFLGVRLRCLEGAALRSAAAPALAQAVLGTFLLGAGARLLLPGWPGSTARAGLPAALLWGLCLSAGEPGLEAGGGAAGGGRGMERLFSLREAHAALSLAFAALLFPVVAQWLVRGAFSIDPLVLGRSLGIGFAAGAAAGLLLRLVLRPTRPPLARALLHLLAAGAAALAAGAAGGSLPVSLIISGHFAGPGAAAPPAGEGGRAPGRAAGPTGGAIPTAELIALLAGAGVLALAASALDLDQIVPALPGAALLWAGSVAVRVLVQLGVGGIQRWRRPQDLPARWLPALAWASPAGPSAAGLLLLGWALSPVETPGTGLRPAGPGGPRAEPVLAVAIAILVQASTSSAVMALAAGSAAGVQGRRRWDLLLARSVALKAERRAVDDLRCSGRLDEDEAAALEGAVASAERRVEEAMASIQTGSPSLRAQELGSALRAVLARGREAVAEARARGWLASGAAEEVERDLSRRWARAGTVPLSELLGSVPEVVPGDGAGPPPRPPGPASGAPPSPGR